MAKKNAHSVRKARNGSKKKKNQTVNKKMNGGSMRQQKKTTNIPSNPCSQSFRIIVPELRKLGWQLFSMYTENTCAGVNGEPEIYETQALSLKNDKLSFILTSYLDGVSISKIEIWDQNECKIEQAKEIVAVVLKFLNRYSIEKVYALTRELGHIKEQDVVLKEVELDQIFRDLGFTETANPGRLMWSNKETLLDTNIEYSLLAGKEDYMDTSDDFLFFQGQVQVYFEFVHQPGKNFVKTFYVDTDEEIRRSIVRFIYSSTDNDEYSTALRNILSQIVGKINIMPKEIASTLFQNLMAVSLALESKEVEYEKELSITASFFIPILHFLLNGNESKIAQYRLVFDEVRETMDIATRFAA